MRKRGYHLLAAGVLLTASALICWQKYTCSRDFHARKLILELSYVKGDTSRPKLNERLIFAASLSSPNSRSYVEITDELAAMGAEVVPLLIEELRRGKNDIDIPNGNRALICLTLSKIGQPAAKPLLDEMESTDIQQLGARGCMARHLGLMGPAAREALPRLLEDLKSDDPLIRCLSARTIAQIDPDLAVREALDIVIGDARREGNLANYGAACALHVIGPVTPEAREAIDLLKPKWANVLQNGGV